MLPVSSVRWSNVPLPEGHLTALAVGLTLHMALPPRLPAPTLTRRVIGPLATALGVLITTWAVVAVRDVDVATPARMVARGPYALSRNPMYVGWTMVYLGVALTLGSRWLLILLPPLLAFTHKTVLQEERCLEARFGRDYHRYREGVRRYV